MRNVQSNFFIQNIFLSLNFLEKKKKFPTFLSLKLQKTKLNIKNKITNILIYIFHPW